MEGGAASEIRPGEPLPEVLRMMSLGLAEAGLAFSVGDAGRRGFPLVHVNEVFTRMTGYGEDEVLGRPCSFLQGEATDREAIEQLRDALRAGLPERVVLRNCTKAGVPFFNELRLLAPRVVGGRRYVAAVQNDVTATYDRLVSLGAERDAYQQQLMATFSELEAADRELLDLRELRRALTPPAPQGTDLLDVATRFVPSEVGVAGDFFLTVPLEDGSVVVAVGDVCGHGVVSAQRASFVRASLTTLASHTTDPGRLLELANASLIGRGGPELQFVTAACAHLVCGPDGGLTGHAALAGHPAPVRLRDGTPVALDPPRSPPLGLSTEFTATSFPVELAPQDGLLLFTDGLLEARAPGAAPASAFGEGRLRAALAGGEGRLGVLDGVVDAVTSHAREVLRDDLCLLAVRAR